MEATKDHEAWESGVLSEDLEQLLREYERSVGGVEGGTPVELIQGASRISAEHANVCQAGPGDANADGEEEGAERLEEGVRDDNNCAAALDGGVDDLTPVQLWDAIIRKYKVAQLCEAELLQLEGKDDLT